MTASGSALRHLFADPKHGRLPALLLALTVVTGLVDAVSILQLGRVFVANMTGNIVFIGFALSGAAGFSLSASVVALAGFLVGAGAGGLLTGRLGSDRRRLLTVAVAAELALVGASGLLATATLTTGRRDTMAGLLAIAMGGQNAVARYLAVPDLTTTVLTMALTGVAADLRAGAAGREAVLRRLLSVMAMLAGAVVGALLIIGAHTAWTLALAAAILLLVGGLARPGREAPPSPATA